MTAQNSHKQEITSKLFSNMNLPDWIVTHQKTIAFVFAIAILVYLAYVYWTSASGNIMQEGFAPHELTDLLDKIRVGIYDNQSVWNNKFYNNQPGRRENPLSFWLPQLTDSNSLPSGYKILGTCVSDNKNYDSPTDTTMLIKGDVKAPTGATDIFTFPHNEITRPRLDKRGQPITRFVLKDIKELKDIDDRILEVESYLEDLNKTYTNIKSSFDIAQEQVEKFMEFDIIAYGPESYFKSSLYNNKIKNGQTITLPQGQYQSLRVPVGASGTLIFEDGHTDTFSFPYSRLLDASNPEKYKNEDANTPLTYKDVTESGADIQKWMITGDYGLGFLRGNSNYIFYRGDGKINSRPYDFATSLNYGFGDMQSDQEYTGLYAHGKADLVDYINSIKTENPEKVGERVIAGSKFESMKNDQNQATKVYLGQRTGGAGTGGNYWFVLSKLEKAEIYTVNNKVRWGTSTVNASKIIESPHLREETTQNIIGFNDIIDDLRKVDDYKRKFMTDNSWYEPGVDGFAKLDDSQFKDGFSVKQVYMDLAFRMHTKKKSLRGGGTDCPSGNGCNCCNIDDDKWVGLTAGGADHGPLVSATIKFNASSQQIPYYRKYITMNANITMYIEGEITAAYKQLAQLYDFKTLINNNGLEPFPLRIIRPIPPEGYESLGDVLFNHRDPGYTAKLPIIDRFGCVPKQCVREMREWLITDKVYEYNRGGKYLAIFKNKYLQTFRASTTPGVLPSGKVLKVVACVEKCQLVDDILTADKCARKFYSSNKAVIESTNLDNDNVVLSRESAIYQDQIRDRQDKITELQDVARKLQVQDAKAEIVNREFNRDKLQNLIGKQQANIAHLGQKLRDQSGQIDINLKFDYAKFMELLYKIDALPPDAKKKIIDIVDTRAGQKLEALPDDVVNAVLAECPTPESEGLVRKSLVESGCYGCADLQ